jgi:hypothetical protein
MVVFLSKEVKKEDSVKKEELASDKHVASWKVFVKGGEVKESVEKKPVSIDDVIKKHMVKGKFDGPKKEVKGDLVKIVQPYKPVPLSESSYFVFMKQLDYERMYSYLGKTKVSTIVSDESIPDDARQLVKNSNDVFTYSEISDYLKKFTVNNLVGTRMNDFSVKEKEVFNNYALFNRQQIVLGMMNLGVVQTDIPAPSKPRIYVTVKPRQSRNHSVVQTDYSSIIKPQFYISANAEKA